MTANRTATKRQTHVESLLVSLVTLTNIKPQEIFKLNIPNHIIQSYTQLRLALHSVTTAKTMVISAPTARNTLDV
jgi:hypothetical protein